MRIALRTGAGRGVYELAGRQGNCVASDLFNHEIFYELTPSIVIPGRSMAAKRQGKPRITLDKSASSNTTHVWRLLSAVLLLPKPKRELKTTHGDAYSMTAIKVDVAALGARDVTLRPTDLLLENADDRRMEVDFTKRMARVIRLWDAAENLDTPLAALVRSLVAAVTAADPDFKEIERRAKAISKALQTTGDTLTLAEERFGLTPEGNNATPTVEISHPIRQDGFGLNDELSPQEALIRRVKQWRQQAVRGSAGRRFSVEVSTAYEYRCIFSGQRLPRLEVTDSPGVDSAHILPWSTHDLNSVRNGLCLSKQCHWAFDQGVLRLGFDQASGVYTVALPPHIKQAAAKASFDLAYFESMAGPVPIERLPKNKASWPSPAYIGELNQHLDAI